MTIMIMIVICFRTVLSLKVVYWSGLSEGAGDQPVAVAARRSARRSFQLVRQE